MSIADFLLARIAEDEAAAWEQSQRIAAYLEAGHVSWPVDMAVNDYEAGWIGYALGNPDGPTSPQKRIAECEAKRRIVARVEANDGVTVEDDWVLNLLALPYADHPDFREEWRA